MIIFVCQRLLWVSSSHYRLIYTNGRFRPEAVAYVDQKLPLYTNNTVDKQLKIWVKKESLTFPGPAHLPFSSFDIARCDRTVKFSS